MAIVRAWVCSTIALLVTAAWPAAHAQDQHAHDVHGGEALVSQLQLNEGRQWPTDATLRESMARIRKTFDAEHPAIHAGRETDAGYTKLATQLEKQVNAMVASCHLAPDVDAQFHYIVADLLQGASWMRGADGARTRHEGAALVHGALTAYGKYFDDPSWRPEPAMKEP